MSCCDRSCCDQTPPRVIELSHDCFQALISARGEHARRLGNIKKTDLLFAGVLRATYHFMRNQHDYRTGKDTSNTSVV